MIGNIFRRKPPEQRFDETVHETLTDKAANLLGHFQAGSNETKSAIARNLLHSAAKVAEEIGAKGLDALIEANAHASILQAADTAARVSSLLAVT